ncbi:MAG TPA: EF-P beta-lysylation protein EpmB [Gammaproteobacteria bacterium]|nr:EF-P beta-lysylation protein EpmB [Gammaproteobacteria bacterium]
MSAQKSPWQSELARMVTCPKTLFSLLELDERALQDAMAAAALFPLRVTHSFISRMEKGNLNDPLLRQVLPLGQELATTPGYTNDPLQEKNANPVPGLLHKYQSRVLVTLTSACAIHCRYCFRRSFPYNENTPGRSGWQALIDYIQQDANINEVILSGGDPLAVNDAYLHEFTKALKTLPQIKRLRIHTRLLVVLPERVTPELLAWLTSLSMKPIIVIHANHPNEINGTVKEALALLQKAGVTLLNQSVLLKNINDNEATLTALSEKLFECGVLPYYLHMLDKVNGAAHFDCTPEKAKQLHASMKRVLPGYLVPKLVVEVAGALSKTWV